MPFVLLIIGIVFLTVAVRGTSRYLVQLLRMDFTGEGNFIYWVAAFLIIGAIGYVESLKKISDGLLVLILLTLFLSKGQIGGKGGGFFHELFADLQTGTSDSGGGIINVNLPPVPTVSV